MLLTCALGTYELSDLINFRVLTIPVNVSWNSRLLILQTCVLSDVWSFGLANIRIYDPANNLQDVPFIFGLLILLICDHSVFRPLRFVTFRACDTSYCDLSIFWPFGLVTLWTCEPSNSLVKFTRNFSTCDFSDLRPFALATILTGDLSDLWPVGIVTLGIIDMSPLIVKFHFIFTTMATQITESPLIDLDIEIWIVAGIITFFTQLKLTQVC